MPAGIRGSSAATTARRGASLELVVAVAAAGDVAAGRKRIAGRLGKNASIHSRHRQPCERSHSRALGNVGRASRPHRLPQLMPPGCLRWPRLEPTNGARPCFTRMCMRLSRAFAIVIQRWILEVFLGWWRWLRRVVVASSRLGSEGSSDVDDLFRRQSPCAQGVS